MTKFAVCVDGTLAAASAVRCLKGLAKQEDELTVVTVVVKNSPDIARSFSSKSHSSAKILADSCEELEGYKVNTDIVSSMSNGNRDIANAIFANCEGKYDVICVGSRGLGLAAATVLGSVSNQLVGACRKSAVLVVPNRQLPTPVVTRVILCCDGSEIAQRAGTFLAKVLTENDELHCISCYPSASTDSHVGLLKTKAQHDCVLSSEAFSNAGGQAIVIEATVPKLNVNEGVLEYIASLKGPVSCVCVGSRGLGFIDQLYLGSATRALLQCARFPVLVVH